MKVFVFDPLWPGLLTEQNKSMLQTAGVEIILTTEIKALGECKELFSGNEPRILAVNPDYVGWSLPADSFKDIPQLKTIITASTSYGWIDTDFAAKNNIPVVNIRNFSTEAVAEWAIMMMLNLARRIPLLIKNGFPLDFDKDFQKYLGTNLHGKKVGIIGLGNNGNAIAKRCHGLGMEVLYWNRTPKNNHYSSCDLETLFKEADVIFPCMADTEDTKNLITDAMLSSMKKDALFVAIVHKVYNKALLLERVANAELGGYGFEADPASFQNYKGNVWAAPAYAWCTDGSLRNSMDLFVKAIADAAKNNFPNRVN